MKDLELLAQMKKEEVERLAHGAWKYQDQMDESFLRKLVRSLRSKRRKQPNQRVNRKPLPHT